jgi:hypothetical protein
MPCASVEEIIFRHCWPSHEIHKFRYINDLLAVVKTLVASCLNAMRSRFSEPCGFWPLQALQADPLRDGHRQVRKIRNPAPAVTSAYCMTSFAARGVHTFASLPDDGRLCAACVKLGPGFRGRTDQYPIYRMHSKHEPSVDGHACASCPGSRLAAPPPRNLIFESHTSIAKA